jgi:cold shock CspA family protein
VLREGRVVAFDAHRGLGAVEDDEGDRFDFHCTQIMDGSRTVEVGVRVCFATVPGGRGRWEAAGIAPSGPATRD